MIIRTVRDDGYEKHDFGPHEQSPEEGVFSILKYELAFGGHVSHFDHYDMVVTTPVLGKTDYVYVHFDSEYERDMMAQALYYWNKASKDVKNDKSLMDDFVTLTKGIALYVTQMGPIFFGMEKLRRTLLYAFGLQDASVETIQRLKDADVDELPTLAELVREGASWEEALECL